MPTPAKSQLVRDTPNTRRLAEHAEVIRELRKKAIESITENVIEIGAHLIAAKTLLGHGHWLSWLDQNFAWSESTARNYMNVARQGKSTTSFADLKLSIASLYQITAPSTPDPVRKKLLKKAKTREVTAEEIDEAIAEVARQRDPA